MIFLFFIEFCKRYIYYILCVLDNEFNLLPFILQQYVQVGHHSIPCTGVSLRSSPYESQSHTNHRPGSVSNTHDTSSGWWCPGAPSSTSSLWTDFRSAIASSYWRLTGILNMRTACFSSWPSHWCRLSKKIVSPSLTLMGWHLWQVQRPNEDWLLNPKWETITSLLSVTGGT